METQSTYLAAANGTSLDQVPSASSSGFTSLPSAISGASTSATLPTGMNGGMNGNGERSYAQVSHYLRVISRY